jgi:hypothetical protein
VPEFTTKLQQALRSAATSGEFHFMMEGLQASHIVYIYCYCITDSNHSGNVNKCRYSLTICKRLQRLDVMYSMPKYLFMKSVCLYQTTRSHSFYDLQAYTKSSCTMCVRVYTCVLIQLQAVPVGLYTEEIMARLTSLRLDSNDITGPIICHTVLPLPPLHLRTKEQANAPPVTISFSRLLVLSLKACGIHELGKDMKYLTSIREIWLEKNLLATLPRVITTLTTLQVSSLMYTYLFTYMAVYIYNHMNVCSFKTACIIFYLQCALF